jgi:cellobiose phosphorylase
MKSSIDKLLYSYCVGVEDPEISGVEHHHMLCIRSELEKMQDQLESSQHLQLAKADRLLIKQAKAFWKQLSAIVDVEKERQRLGEIADHWWWYLDVIAAMPSQSDEATLF